MMRVKALIFNQECLIGKMLGFHHRNIILFAAFCFLSLACSSESRIKTAELDIESGVKYFESGKYQEAIEHLERGLKVRPKHKQGLIYAGKAYEKTENFKKAVDAWQKYMFINIPSSPEAVRGQQELDRVKNQLDAQRQWLKIKNKKDLDVFVNFNKKYPDSVYIQEVEKCIEKLKNES